MSIAGLIVLYFLVKINEAQRVITINYAKRVHGNSNYGDVKSILPVKLIAAGSYPSHLRGCIPELATIRRSSYESVW